MGNIFTVSRKKAKVLVVSRKSHHPSYNDGKKMGLTNKEIFF